MSPRALIVAGPNGSGKTTFAEEYLRSESVSFLSADLLAAGLAAPDPGAVRIEAGRRFVAELQAVIAQRCSFALEATLAGTTLASSIRRMREAGYTVSLVFVFLRSAEACRARIRERVAKGGHPVPDADVQRRFGRSIRNFWRQYRPLVDRWFLFYNGGTQFHAVALGEGDATEVHDEALFREFRHLAGEEVA